MSYKALVDESPPTPKHESHEIEQQQQDWYRNKSDHLPRNNNNNHHHHHYHHRHRRSSVEGEHASKDHQQTPAPAPTPAPTPTSSPPATETKKSHESHELHVPVAYPVGVPLFWGHHYGLGWGC